MLNKLHLLDLSLSGRYISFLSQRYGKNSHLTDFFYSISLIFSAPLSLRKFHYLDANTRMVASLQNCRAMFSSHSVGEKVVVVNVTRV
jgi:hypothetical protein